MIRCEQRHTHVVALLKRLAGSCWWRIKYHLKCRGGQGQEERRSLPRAAETSASRHMQPAALLRTLSSALIRARQTRDKCKGLDMHAAAERFSVSHEVGSEHSHRVSEDEAVKRL